MLRSAERTPRSCGSTRINLWSQNQSDKFDSLPSTCNSAMRELGLTLSFDALKNGRLGVSAVLAVRQADLGPQNRW